MKKKTIILVTLALMLLGVNTNAQMSEKPRVSKQSKNGY